MPKLRRFVLWGFIGLLTVAAVLAFLLYTPTAEPPQLSGKLTRQTMDAGSFQRTYQIYIPNRLPKGAPLVLVLHGSGENGTAIRHGSGYGFDRLADEKGFVVAYPDGFEGYWNACNIVGDYSANKLNIDDVGFLTSLSDKLSHDFDLDPARTFATGVSRGGHMALRLALEAPSRFRAVAAVAASVPAPENFKCKPTPGGIASVMIMNGTKDPLNPFEGGDVKLFGLLARGKVLSWMASGKYFADLNHLSGPPVKSEKNVSHGFPVEQAVWRDSSSEVELVAIQGGGHALPQPYIRMPRIRSLILGPTAEEPNGPAMIWDFFEHQTRR